MAPSIGSRLIATIKKRPDFLAIRGGKRFSAAGFLIEAKPRSFLRANLQSETVAKPNAGTARFGFTVTKKLGGAVVRNRIRRRLKAAVTASYAGLVNANFDYVIVARTPALTMHFDALTRDFVRAFRHIHKVDRDTSKESA